MREVLNWMAGELKEQQLPGGAWAHPFETGIKTDCFMVVLLKALKINEPVLMRRLIERIAGKRESDGSYRLFHDQEEGDVSTAAEAYYALLLSGKYKEEDPDILAIKRFILSKGGIRKTGLFTRILLALTSQAEWPAVQKIPIESILLPKSFPVSMYDLSVYGRANLIPILVAASKKYQIRIEGAPDLSSLSSDRTAPSSLYRSREWRGLFDMVSEGAEHLVGTPERLKEAALKKAEAFMLGRLESDGTLYSYFSCTFLMIFALLALGYDKEHPVIKKAVAGLIAMAVPVENGVHMQYTTAHVWNTSLLSGALQKAGFRSSMTDRANRYLLTRQHHLYGDWAVHNPYSAPGGWGFSDINSLNPDIDDTSAVLRAIHHDTVSGKISRGAWDRGLEWLLSMQNGDGGWASFERNASPPFVHFIPVENAEFIISDASSADLTGRTMEFLCAYAKLPASHDQIRKAAGWLIKHQERDGSWNSRWGICYVYGTWAAVTGLASAGYGENHEVISRAKAWLESVQNPDGGWGESCKSDQEKRYIPLGTSTLTQTAWATEALLCCSEGISSSAERGIRYLAEHAGKKDWTAAYPKGQGFAGQFYIHYHSYDFVFPMLALSRYLERANSLSPA